MATKKQENLPSQTGGFDPDLVLEMERLTGLRKEELFRGIAPDVANTILGPRTAISPEREFEIRQGLIETMEELAATAQKRDQVTMEAWYKLKVQAMKSASQVEAAGISAHGRTEAAHISGLHRQAAAKAGALEDAYSSLTGVRSKDTVDAASKAIIKLGTMQGKRTGPALLGNATNKNNFIETAVDFLANEQDPTQRQAFFLEVSNNTGIGAAELIKTVSVSAQAGQQKALVLGPKGEKLNNLMNADMPLGNIATLQMQIDQDIAAAAKHGSGGRGANAVASGLLNAVSSSVPGQIPLGSLQTLGVTAQMMQDPKAAATMEDAAQEKINDLFEDLADAVERTPYIQGQIDSIMATAGIQGSPFREYLVSNGLNPDSPADLEAGFELLEDEYADVREYESGQAKLRAQVARERQKAELRKRKEYEAGMGPERMAAKQVVQGIDLDELPEAEEGPSGYAPPQRVGMGLREDQLTNMRVIESRLRAAADQAEKAGDTDRARYLRQEADRYLQLQSRVTDIQMGLPSIPDPMTIDAAQKAADESAVPETFGVAGGEAGIETQDVAGVPKKVGDSEYYVMPNQGGQLFHLKDGKFARVEPPTERRPDDFAVDYEDLDMEGLPTKKESPPQEAGLPDKEVEKKVDLRKNEDVVAETSSLKSAGATKVSPKIPGDDYSPYATFKDGSYGFVHPDTGKLIRVRPGSTAHSNIESALNPGDFKSGDLIERAKKQRLRKEAKNRAKSELEQTLDFFKTHSTTYGNNPYKKYQYVSSLKSKDPETQKYVNELRKKIQTNVSAMTGEQKKQLWKQHGALKQEFDPVAKKKPTPPKPPARPTLPGEPPLSSKTNAVMKEIDAADDKNINEVLPGDYDFYVSEDEEDK